MVAPGNVSRIRRLADAVERSETYDQSTWWFPPDPEADVSPHDVHPSCGSPGCLAGHARLLWGVQGDGESWLDQLEEGLGTEPRVAGALFGAEWDRDWLSHLLGVSLYHVLPEGECGYSAPTRHQAAAVLRAWADAIEAEGS